jgi:hypothetical protein
MKSDPFAYDPEDAYYGPLGEIAKRYRDHIPINLLPFHSMLVTAAGSLVGRRVAHSYFKDKHFCILFNAIVGETGCGKGTSLNIVRSVIEEIDPTAVDREGVDAASGPGVIDLVRDASKRIEGKRVIEDEGVTDKRALIVLEEMEVLFTSIRRKGSTLEKVLNLAYDGRTLQTAARAKQKATNPHISFIGQITPDPFREIVSSGHGRSNGFFNRFLTVCATKKKKRARSHGADLPDVSDLVEVIRCRLAELGDPLATTPKEIRWHESSHKAWEDFVAAMEADHPFLNGLGGMSARLISNTVRVAMLLAVIDGSDFIMPQHLNAAKSFCLQCIDSSREFFTKNGGPKTQSVRLGDRILAGVGDEPVTITQIHEVLHKKGYDAETLRAALAALVSSGQLVIGTKDSVTGRSLTTWAKAQHAETDCLLATAIEPLMNDADLFENLVNNFSPECEHFFEDQTEDAAFTADSEPVAEDVDPNVLMIAGMRLRLVAPFSVRHDADALTLDDRPTSVRSRQKGFLVAIAEDATPSQQARAHSLREKKPNHLLAAVEGQLLYVKRGSLKIKQLHADTTCA